MDEAMLLKIKRIVEDNLEVQLGDDQLEADLTELGMQSILFIKIVVALENEFECEIPDSKMIMKEMNTLQKTYNAVSLSVAESSEI